MIELAFEVSGDLCGECPIALKRFVGRPAGVQAIDIEPGKVVIRFDEAVIDEKTFIRIARDNIEKVGYSLKA